MSLYCNLLLAKHKSSLLLFAKIMASFQCFRGCHAKFVCCTVSKISRLPVEVVCGSSPSSPATNERNLTLCIIWVKWKQTAPKSQIQFKMADFLLEWRYGSKRLFSVSLHDTYVYRISFAYVNLSRGAQFFKFSRGCYWAITTPITPKPDP